MKDVHHKLEPRTYLRRYIMDYLLSNLVAYVVIVIYIAGVSGYPLEEIRNAFVRSRIPLAILLSVMSAILYRLLLPLRRAMMATGTSVPVSEDLTRRVVRTFRNYRYYVFVINLIAYPLVILLSILSTYRATGLIQPYQWWILINGTLVVFAVTVFQQTLFNLRSIPVKEYLGLHTFSGVRSSSLALAIAGAVLSFLVSFGGTAYNNTVRATRLFAQEETRLLTAIESAATMEEVRALVGRARADVPSFARRQDMISLGYTAGMLVVCALGVYIYAREIRSHVGVTRDKLAEITSEGCDLTQKVVVTAFNDLGLLNQAVNKLIDRNRDLYGRIAKAASWLGQASTSLGGLATQLVDHSESMQGRSAHVSGEAAALEGKMRSLFASAGELDGSIANVSEAAGQMNQSISRIASSTREAQAATADAVTAVQASRQRVSALGDRAQEIGKLIDTITSIGRATNILSLNAQVEAARAGAAGRGFAVVAGEVKRLSRQVNDAAEDVRSNAQAIQELAGDVMQEVGTMTQAAEKVNGIVASISGSLDEQARSTADISRLMSRASADVGGMAAGIETDLAAITAIAGSAQTVLETSQGVSTAGRQIGSSAGDLAEVSDRLQAEVRAFRV